MVLWYCAALIYKGLGIVIQYLLGTDRKAPVPSGIQKYSFSTKLRAANKCRILWLELVCTSAKPVKPRPRLKQDFSWGQVCTQRKIYRSRAEITCCSRMRGNIKDPTDLSLCFTFLTKIIQNIRHLSSAAFKTNKYFEK